MKNLSLKSFVVLTLIIALEYAFLSVGIAQDEPALPMGLGAEPEEPSLPAGLGSEEESAAFPSEEDYGGFPLEFSGFWETRIGVRTQEDPHQQDLSIGETRLQLSIEKSWEKIVFDATADFLYDHVLDRCSIELEEGQGFVDLREASLLFRPTSILDIKAGRQILTWGTGDLVFINDLFPKDWNSFFIGRDEEYLKAPSDAVKISLFSGPVNVDLVYSPRFDADRFIDGRRISYFNKMLGRQAGRDAVVDPDKPDDWFADDEIALRLFKNVSGYELALYGYSGYWKSPNGMDVMTDEAIFPELDVYGASVRGTIGRGIGNVEIGYYDSTDDEDGDDPFTPNSEFRFLVGYEQDLARNFTAGFQYYLEHMIDHEDYKMTLPAGMPEADEDRHVLTLRLTRLLMNQNLILMLFGYYSPSDRDTYLRPKIHYKVNDFWSLETGANIFAGEDEHTFFGQFENNSNVYVAVRYSF